MTNSAKNIEVKLFLKDIPSHYWNKIEVSNDWDKEYRVDKKAELPMMVNHHTANVWDKRFKSDEMLTSFKKFTNGEDKFFIWRGGVWGAPKIKDIALYNGDANDNKNWYYFDDSSKLTQYLRNANKLFIKDGHGKLTSQAALEFLKTIVNCEKIEASLKTSNFFELEKEVNELNQKLTNQQIVSKEIQKQTIDLEKSLSRLTVEKELLENNLKEKDKEKQLAINEIKKVNEKHLSELSELVEEIGSELLERKQKDLKQLLSEVKSKLEEKLWSYLDILLLMPDKSEVGEMAKKNLVSQINGNDLQKLILLQHEINKLEKRINETSQQVAQIEILPPSYN